MLHNTPLSSYTEPARPLESQRSSTGRVEHSRQDISYAGAWPDLDHQTISLRTQLRLSYETYDWVRYITWSGWLLLAILLLLLPGFPPHSFVLLWQMVPLIGRLFALHGIAALFSLATLAIQTLTWLLLWGILLACGYTLGTYTWRLYQGRTFLQNSGWLPSKSADATSTAPGISLPHIRHLSSSPLSYTASMVSAVPTKGTPQATSPARAPHVGQASATARQFAQPSMPTTRPRALTPTTDFSFNWPSSSAENAPGVAWDTGITRKGRPNEDSVLTLRGTCNVANALHPFELHIVADGMGGHANGRLASHLAIRSMLETIVPGLIACAEIESEEVVNILIDGVHWANQVIYQFAMDQGVEMGTTVTAALVLNEMAYIINVGDSRTYVYRPQHGLSQITRDHSLVARLVENGTISPDEVYTHPDRNKVYRGLGDKTDVTVDWFILPVQPGDLLLLCSDGLWEMVRDRHIAELLATYSRAPALASNALLQAALQAGGNDNVSLLVVRI